MDDGRGKRDDGRGMMEDGRVEIGVKCAFYRILGVEIMHFIVIRKDFLFILS